jgi:hypothetical protein
VILFSHILANLSKSHIFWYIACITLGAKIEFVSTSNIFLEKERWLHVMVGDDNWEESVKCMNYPGNSLYFYMSVLL